jgi:pyrrolidone-carboxylate peptidase
MAHPLVLLTGFGAFDEVDRNPSKEVALGLEAEPGCDLCFASRILPVSFVRVPGEIDRFLEEHGGGASGPVLIMSMGAHKDPGFRLEACARARLFEEDRPDVDGVNAIEVAPYDGPDRSTVLDLEGLVRTLRQDGIDDVFVSRDAGGYVCERTYFRVLERASEAGCPGLFVHVPPIDFTPIARQVEVCRSIACAALR